METGSEASFIEDGDNEEGMRDDDGNNTTIDLESVSEFPDDESESPAMQINEESKGGNQMTQSQRLEYEKFSF